MEISIPIDELRKRSIFLGTPMYGGQCTGIFTRSVMDLTTLCTQYGVSLTAYFLFNESLITRARNYIADAFLRSNFTHLLFIDSDIGFKAMDVMGMLALQSDDSPYDVLGAPYPKKTISWEKIKAAVDQGVADDDPTVLERFVGDYVFNPKSDTINLAEPTEVAELGTGFMMIRRATLVKFREKYPEYMYRPDHVRSSDFDGSREIMQFFQAEIEPVHKRYLSEDYWFCRKVQAIDMKCWLLPWIETSHFGAMNFGGSLLDIAKIGASPTVDPDKIKKTKTS